MYFSLGNAQVGLVNPEFDSYIIEQLATGGFDGMAAAVIIDDEMASSQGYGYANLEAKIPFTTGTLINSASLTRTITSACYLD